MSDAAARLAQAVRDLINKAVRPQLLGHLGGE
jgi:Fe-S cluster biogenesis protein NfuA